MFKGREIDTIISPKHVTLNEILRYVRAIAASGSEGSILSLYKIVGGKVEVLEFEADADMKEVINIPLSVLKIKKNVLIACIVRSNKALVPKGSDMIMPGDSVLVVSANGRITGLCDIIDEIK
jgi:trk system potassium uptake protein TrkA